MERNPSGSTLEFVDEKNAGTRIHISHAEAQCLSEADPGAVEDEHQCPIEAGSKRRALEVRAETEQFHNVVLGEIVRYEA
jgi:hypothetical protein